MCFSTWRSLNACGVALTIRLTPKSACDAIDGVGGLSGWANLLLARVRAAPSKGEANTALIQLFAKALGIPSRDIVLAVGATGRIKRLLISGEGPRLIAALEKITTPR
jgi:uncharacterized protein YggU (UPF0235/DUF167 family)